MSARYHHSTTLDDIAYGICFEELDDIYSSRTSSSKNASRRSSQRTSSSSSRYAHSTPELPQRLGITKQGKDCKICIKKGDFCHLHVDQRHSNSSLNRSITTTATNTILGITQAGLECKRCIAQEKFCYQHEHQDPARSQESYEHLREPFHSGLKERTPRLKFGVTKDGSDCKRCIMQSKFCYQHVSQDPSSGGSGPRQTVSGSRERNSNRRVSNAPIAYAPETVPSSSTSRSSAPRTSNTSRDQRRVSSGTLERSGNRRVSNTVYVPETVLSTSTSTPSRSSATRASNASTDQRRVSSGSLERRGNRRVSNTALAYAPETVHSLSTPQPSRSSATRKSSSSIATIEGYTSHSPVTATNDREHKKECAICMEDIHDHERYKKVSCCKNRFHRSCLSQWLQTGTTCPMCRARMH